MSHGRTVCTHGALITQCRCMDHKQTTVVACPWPEAHADYPTLSTTPVAPGTDHSGEVEAVIAWLEAAEWRPGVTAALATRIAVRRLRAALAARRPHTEAEEAVRVGDLAKVQFGGRTYIGEVTNVGALHIGVIDGKGTFRWVAPEDVTAYRAVDPS